MHLGRFRERQPVFRLLFLHAVRGMDGRRLPGDFPVGMLGEPVLSSALVDLLAGSCADGSVPGRFQVPQFPERARVAELRRRIHCSGGMPSCRWAFRFSRSSSSTTRRIATTTGPRTGSAGEYLAFILFFPTMVAGPIKRYQDFLPKLRGGFARVGGRLAARSDAHPGGPGEEIRGGRRADRLHQPLELGGHQPRRTRTFCRCGFWPTESRFTPTFRRIRISPSARRGSLAFACRKISIGPTCEQILQSSGGTGTCR